MKCLGTAPVEVLASADGMRHMEITMRLKRDYVEITDVIWAVHDRSTGTPFIKKGETASAGLKAFVEDDQTTLLLAELETMKQNGEIKSYGIAGLTPLKPTSTSVIGQEYNFQVSAGANDNLVFAAVMPRSNDRFVSPLAGGIPMFVGLKPNYGLTNDFTLWDAGTEVNQPYHANLHLGYQSSQQGGGIPGGAAEGGVIHVVNASEYAPFGEYNVSYPKPTDFMNVYIHPAMDVVLSSSVRAEKPIDIMLEFTMEATRPAGNEIAVQFPEGFTFHEGGATVSNVTWWWWQRYIGQKSKADFDDAKYGQPQTHVDERSRTVYIRWHYDINIKPDFNLAISITIRNVGNPNNCDLKTWYLKARKCDEKNLNDAGVWMVRTCGPDLYDLQTRATTAVPTGCNRCNACSFQYTNTAAGMDVFSCEDNGKTFIRERVSTLSVFPEYFDGGAFTGNCVP
jgi:hypothetical protein